MNEESSFSQELLEKVFDTLDSYVYVTDLDTDEILFVNRKMSVDFGADKPLRGDVCWRRLQQGQEKRCDFCSKPRLLADPGQPVTYEKYNPVLGKTFNIIDRIIDWPGGRRVYMEQAVDITETKQANEYAKLMLDAIPLGGILLDGGHNIIGSNGAAVRLFEANDKEEFEKRFFECSPEYQPDGGCSEEEMHRRIDKTFAEGRCVFEWMYKTLGGMPVPAEVTLVKLSYGSSYVVAGYIRDLREYRRMMHDIEYKSLLLQTVNRMLSIILKSGADTMEENLSSSMGILAQAVNADRMYVWRNYRKDGKLHCSQIYEWSGGAQPQQGYELAKGTLYADIVPGWEELLSSGRCINGIVGRMTADEQAALSPQGILSVLIVPIFLDGRFWGFVGFDDCHDERIFSETEEIILRSASELIAGALSHTRLETEAGKIFYDQLTGIYNRRFFDSRIGALIKGLSRSHSVLSVMMIDIDYFKQYNDRYGHIEGDACLRAVSDILQESLMRKDDFVVRYGGEEFVAVLPNTDEKGARMLAERLLEAVRKRDIPHDASAVAGCVTISIGAVTGEVQYTHKGNDFIRRADEMLYAAKQQGRNRYVFSALQKIL